MRSRAVRTTALAVTAALAVGMVSAPGAPAGWARAASAGGAHRPVPGAVAERFEAPEVVWAPGSRGVKLEAAAGDPVRAALPGVVTFAGTVAGEAWVTVDHGGGLDTTYGPVDAAVPAGRRVRAGEVIGDVDERGGEGDGEDGGPLHWGARLDGDYIDPLSLLDRWRPRLVAGERGG